MVDKKDIFKDKSLVIKLIIVVAILLIFLSVIIFLISGNNESAETNYYDILEKNIDEAAHKYVKKNGNKLVQKLGDKAEIKISTLEKEKFIDEVKDYNGKKCSNDSNVQIFKYSNEKYGYVINLDCPNYNNKKENNNIKPYVKIEFDHKKVTGGSKYNVAKTKVIVKGSKLSNVKLFNYSYVIYKNGEEILRKDDVSVASDKNIEIEEDLLKYVPAEITIEVKATNNKGLTTSIKKTFDYKDTEKPVCVIQEADKETSVKNWIDGERTITVGCSDGDGSGCVQDTYTKNFNEETKIGIITIEDKYGNKEECKVSVYVDKTAPTVTVKAYKRTADGGKEGNIVGTVVANNKNREVLLSDYDNSVNGWLNLEKYPYGIYYEFEYTDVGGEFATKIWNENDPYLIEAAGVNSSTYHSISTDIHGISNDKVSASLVEEGYRKANYAFTDEAGHTVVVNLIAKIDRTIPQIAMNAYKRDVNGNSIGNVVASSVTSSAKNKVEVSNYSDTVNGWLNGINYPYGINYSFNFSDNMGLTSGSWKYNTAGLSISRGQDSDVKNENKMEINDLVGYVNIGLKEDGYRKAVMKITDVAGNSSHVNLVAKIDRAAPTCDVKKFSTYTTSGVTVRFDCNEKISSTNCLPDKTNLKSSANYDIIDGAGNVGVCAVKIGSVTDYSKRIRSWNECLTGNAKSCVDWGYEGTCTCYDRKKKADPNKYECIASTCDRTCKLYSLDFGSGKGTCNYECTETENTCKAGWNPWSSWSGYIYDSGCASDTCQSIARTRYY